MCCYRPAAYNACADDPAADRVVMWMLVGTDVTGSRCTRSSFPHRAQMLLRASYGHNFRSCGILSAGNLVSGLSWPFAAIDSGSVIAFNSCAESMRYHGRRGESPRRITKGVMIHRILR